MLSKMKTLLRNITVEPAMFSYFLAIYLLYSVFHPTVMDRYLKNNSELIQGLFIYDNLKFAIYFAESAQLTWGTWTPRRSRPTAAAPSSRWTPRRPGRRWTTSTRRPTGGSRSPPSPPTSPVSSWTASWVAGAICLEGESNLFIF